MHHIFDLTIIRIICILPLKSDMDGLFLVDIGTLEWCCNIYRYSWALSSSARVGCPFN